MMFGGIASVCTALMMLHVVADVMSRWLFGQPMSGTTEFASIYYLVPLTFLPLALVQLRDGHISVELVTRMLSERSQRVLMIAVTALALAATAFITWASAVEAFSAYRVGEVIETASSVMIIWPSRFIVAAGIGFMAVVLAWQLFKRIGGDPAIDSAPNSEL